MNHVEDSVIVISRINYKESDRILTVLGQKYGKRRVLAKGVRKSTSKLAGNVELFNVVTINTVGSKSTDLSVLTGAKMTDHYQNLIKDIDKTMMVYEWVKIVDKLSPDGQGREYFDPLMIGLKALDEAKVSPWLVNCWLFLQMIEISGHKINWHKMAEVNAQESYDFDFESNSFRVSKVGGYRQDTLKIIKYLGELDAPKQIVSPEDLQKSTSKLLQQILNSITN